MEENSRKEEIKNTLLDTATEEVKSTGSKAVKTVIHDIEDWIAELQISLHRCADFA